MGLTGCARRIGAGEQGQMLPFTAVLLALVLLPVAAFVVDGGILLMERRGLANVADAAATAGAQQIDEVVYRSSGGSVVVLNQQAAYAVAYQRAAEAGVQVEAVRVTSDRVEVVVATSVPTSFARVFGIDRMTGRASSTALPRYDARSGP